MGRVQLESTSRAFFDADISWGYQEVLVADFALKLGRARAFCTCRVAQLALPIHCCFVSVLTTWAIWFAGKISHQEVVLDAKHTVGLLWPKTVCTILGAGFA